MFLIARIGESGYSAKIWKVSKKKKESDINPQNKNLFNSNEKQS
jgi:hypothetical protein